MPVAFILRFLGLCLVSSGQNPPKIGFFVSVFEVYRKQGLRFFKLNVKFFTKQDSAGQ